ncbi:MAG: hypothetical protein NZ989_06640, partial [Bacteroidia bacterium]|nr:hypothetical protein [Bacteroidia bacterium]
RNNLSEGSSSAILGGEQNQAVGAFAIALGGVGNLADQWHAAVLSGRQNRATAQYGIVIGGANNTAAGDFYNAIVSGRANEITNGASRYNTVLNGEENILQSGNYNAILGGLANRLNADEYSTILTGRENGINASTAAYALILGGRENSITSGGSHNSILNGRNGTIIGGEHNLILGGVGNSIDGNYVIAYGNGVNVVGEDRRVYLFTEQEWGALVMNRPDNPENYPIRVGTPGGNNGNDAYLTQGGVWTGPSSRRIKDRYQKLSPQEVLMKVRRLPVEGWYYKGTQEYHIGPYAEDFYEAFGTGVGNKEDARTHLAASDVGGVALLSIQALAQQQDELLEELRRLREEVQALRQENSALRQALGHAQR